MSKEVSKQIESLSRHCHTVQTNESPFRFHIAPVLTLVVLTLLSGVLTWRQFAFGLPPGNLYVNCKMTRGYWRESIIKPTYFK